MLDNENQALQTSETSTLSENIKNQFERERLSRRQALKKFGMTSAMATFALFSVDDLAHLVGKAMQRQAGDNKIVEQLAHEFQNTSVAMASTYSPGSCSHCGTQYGADVNAATAAFITCYNDQLKAGLSVAQATKVCDTYPYCPDINNAVYAYDTCCAAHCPPGFCADPTKAPGC